MSETVYYCDTCYYCNSPDIHGWITVDIRGASLAAVCGVCNPSWENAHRIRWMKDDDFDRRWTVYQAPSGRWIARNARGRDFAVRNTREEAEAAVETHKQRINKYGRKS